MKARQKHILSLCLLLGLVAVACLILPIGADGNTPDFTMEAGELNVPASALLAIDNCFSYDRAQFSRGGTLISCNDAPGIPDEAKGQILLNGGRGDAYTFTVDFGAHAVDSLGFYSYGTSAVDTVVGLEIDGEDMGTAIVYAGNGWADADPSVWYYNEITFPHTVTGFHTVVIRIVDSAPAWPANVVGNFLFFEERQAEPETEFVPVPETSAETDTGTEPEPNTDTDTNSNTNVATAPVTDAASGTETQTTPQTDMDVELPPDDFHGCSCSGNLSGLSGVAFALCLMLMASLFVSCNGNGTTLSTESEISSETVSETVTDTVAETVTEPETESENETITETTVETDTETEPNTGDYSFNTDEQAALREEAERMKGLTATYYSDRKATQAVSTEVVGTVDRLFQKGSGISAAVYEGYITFAESGTYTVKSDGDANMTVAIGKGEHHVTSGKSVTVEAVAGAQYSIKLTADWRGDKVDMTLRLLVNDSTEGFSLSVGRVLIEHEDVSATVIHDIPLRDTFICTGPDGYYYMTGTTGPDFWNNNYVIHVYRSKDLLEWTDLGWCGTSAPTRPGQRPSRMIPVCRSGHPNLPTSTKTGT